MAKKCPNCGYENQNEANFCEACGNPLPKTEDFEYNFGADMQNATAANIAMSVQQEQENFIPIKIETKKANKLKKDLFSWSIFLIVFCALRFVFTFAVIGEVGEISQMLPQISGDIKAVLQEYVNVYYVSIVFLTIGLASAIALVVYTTKCNQIHFPVNDEKVFAHYKSALIASIIALVVAAIYFILELSMVGIEKDMSAYLGEDVLSTTQLVGAFIGDILMLCGAIVCVVNSARLANCREK